ncbi:aspartate kinase [Limibacillus sp. MBR-115]|uniref:aspartate kinase n=1 Tax=Limibacillus sp. MBR-115 TaxID=3156465 RepID=UPI003396EDD1
MHSDNASPGRGYHSVHKIGGTSMADTKAVLENIFLGKRSRQQIYGRIFVVSAYSGFTDLLLENKKTGEAGVFHLYAGSDSDWAWGDALTAVADQMYRRNREIFGPSPEQKIADAFIRERIEGTRSCLMDLHRLCAFGHFKLQEHLDTVREMLSALGELHSAHNTVLLLKKEGVNAVLVDLSGWRDPDSLNLDERITQALAGRDLARELPIVTGYAQAQDGMMRRYGRGYSEVTFSRIAYVTKAREAVIHKEYHLSSGDPKIIGADRVRPIGRTNYDVADQLSNMGMEAIHPRAAKALRQRGIPLRVVNTFEPDHPGTAIEDGWLPDTTGPEIITGISSAMEIEVFDQDHVGQPGSEEPIVMALSRFKIPTVTKSINANCVTHYVTAPLKQVRRAIAVIEAARPEAKIRTQKVAIVSVIGARLDAAPLFSEAVAALQKGGVLPLASICPSRAVDLQFVLSEEDYEKAIRLLHHALMEERAVRSASTLAA